MKRLSAKTILAWTLALLIVIWGHLGLQAQNTPPRPEPPRLVNDLAHMLNSQQIDELENRLVGLSEEYGVQLAILTVPSLEGSDIESYGNKVFNSWGIGQKGKDNGLLILVAQEEREMSIEVGYGLEANVTDAEALAVISNDLRPAFRQQEYGQGLLAAAQNLALLSTGKDLPGYEAPKQKRRKSRDVSPGEAIIGIIVLLLALWIFRKNPWLLLFLLNSGGGRGGGFGDFSGGRGSFGGFGGGRSGGGGASGSW